MRKLKLRTKPKLVTINKKVEKREARREEKALTAAKIEKSIEQELLQRLKQVETSSLFFCTCPLCNISESQGTYGSIYNFPEQASQKALETAEEEMGEIEEEDELELEDEADSEEEREFVEVELQIL